MSRNCSKCGDTTCNCAIIEGPGIGVTGTGSGASPYIVEADIVHVDTPTVTLTGNGGSTPLSAVVNPCGLTDSLNEVSSGSLLVKGTAPDCLALLDPGVAGKAVISNGTEFVLGDAASPGVTNYCDSVTGVPTGYGVIDSALGVEKYYDLNGTVVALRPASWEPCCCDSAGVTQAPFVLSTQTTAQTAVPAATFSPVTTTSAIATLTNPSGTESMIVHHRNLANVAIGVAFNNASQCQYTFETNINGAGFGVIGLGRLGVNAVGTTAGVPFIDNADGGSGFTTQVLLAPGASITFQSRSTMQVLNAIANPVSCTGGISIEARGWYI